MYPIHYNLKISPLVNTLIASNAINGTFLYAVQDLPAFNEPIHIFADSQKKILLGEFYNEILEQRAAQTYVNASGQTVMHVCRPNSLSAWRAQFEVMTIGGDTLYMIKVKNSWVNVLDMYVSLIPFFGIFLDNLFKHTYEIFDMNKSLVGVIEKKTSFLRSKYVLNINESMDDPGSLLPIATLMIIIRLRKRP